MMILMQLTQSVNFDAPYRVFNIGNGNPIKLLDFINTLEKSLGKKAILDFKPLQPGML